MSGFTAFLWGYWDWRLIFESLSNLEQKSNIGLQVLQKSCRFLDSFAMGRFQHLVADWNVAFFNNPGGILLEVFEFRMPDERNVSTYQAEIIQNGKTCPCPFESLTS